MIDSQSLERISKLNSKSKFSSASKIEFKSLELLEDFQISSKDINRLLDWNFDILSVEALPDKFRHIFTMFHSLNFFESFGVDSKTFGRFVSMLQTEYDKRNNPFHNFNHGITVAHGAYFLLKNSTISEMLPALEKFAFLFSALCHDVDHTGRNNAFECASFSKLAIRYNDESVL